MNDGTSTNWTVKTVIAPATTVTDFPDNPARTDYTFANWNTQADGSGTDFTATTTVYSDITVYAQWADETYTVSFKSNYGNNNTLYTRRVTGVTTISAGNFPAVPKRTNYTFAKWTTQANGSGSEFTASTTVSASITVYAQWINNTYTVTFDNDGGDTAANPATKTVTYPATTIDALPAPPSRPGHNFGGWYTERNGEGSAFTAWTTVNTDITVYAKWTGKTYTVSFKSNVGTDAILYTKTVTVPATTIATADFPTDPTRPTYNFGGWNTASNGSGSNFTASTEVSADITVYAQWIGKTYTVRFNSNDGTDTTLYTRTVTVPATTITEADFPPDPARTGYIFAGWYNSTSEWASAFTASTIVEYDNVMVYAKWNEYSYTITFNNDGGTTAANPATKTVASPATTIDTLPAQPSRTGYNFGGWYTGQNGAGTAFTAQTTVTSSITVYAKWDEYAYTVTFNNNGGDTAANPATKTVASPTTTIDALPVSPRWTEHSFMGWNTAADGSENSFTASTEVSADITIYAQWLPYGQGSATLIYPMDAADNALNGNPIVISKSSGTHTHDLIVSGDFDSYRWWVDGSARGNGNTFTLNAADYVMGNHQISLEVILNGAVYSKSGAFTVQ
jgi:uncharacterized repeat protein (TIGR02543 family)